MGLEDLKRIWAEHREEWGAEETSGPKRERVLEEDVLPLIAQLRGGQLSPEEFRYRSDTLSKTENRWGFRGGGQMFLNILVKDAVQPVQQDLLRAELAEALDAPADEIALRMRFERFRAYVADLKIQAKAAGLPLPEAGFIPFFLSFFWEAQRREGWPVYYPNSRQVLARHGLFAETGALVDRYLMFSEAIGQLREELSTDTWGVELLLWRLGKGAAKPEPPGNGGPVPVEHSEDLYAEIAAQNLVVPTEMVTTLVLSLIAKRFVILSGISGTGKTRVAQELAQYLDRRGAPVPAVPAEPETTADEAFIRLTEANLRRGRFVLRLAHLETFPIPEPGHSVKLTVPLPSGGEGLFRLNNIGFSDPTRRPTHILFCLAGVREWLSENAQPGQYLRFAFDGTGGVSEFGLVAGTEPVPMVDGRRYELVAVRSDWTDPRGLIGYFNPLTEQYVRTPLLELIERAAKDPESPYLAILDEMNLARVEYYFSDFLSAIESGEPISLGVPPGSIDEDEDADEDVPSRVLLPRNLLFVGTVNIDETTHAFSPKVLDRANVIEFSGVSIEAFLGQAAEPDASTFRLVDGILEPGWLVSGPPRLAEKAEELKGITEVVQPLVELHGVLARFDRHFGYRVMKEILSYVAAALCLVQDESEEDTMRTALDHQVLQKVLPKLTGGRELEAPLAHVLRFLLDGSVSKTGPLDSRKVLDEAEAALGIGLSVSVVGTSESGETEPQAPAFPRSAAKVARMLRRLDETGFTAFLE